jgi:DNA-directed RNA polymerase beta subunit
MENSTIWKIIDQYFIDNPQSLVRHHIESYDDFFKNGILQIFKEKNPLRIQTQYDEEIGDYRHQCIMYLGGKSGDKIYFGKPVIYDDNQSHYMYPNEARLRNMTYGMTIHYDIEIEFINNLRSGEQPGVPGLELIEGGFNDAPNFEYIKDKTTAGLMAEEELSKHLNRQEQTGGNNEYDKLEQAAGGPKGPPKRRKQRKLDTELTAAETALFREAIEKSMVAPNVQKETVILEKILLGKFPIMVQSHYCVLSGLPREVRHTMGECRNDVGGYFIIDGKEKTVISQEKFGYNMLNIRKGDDHLLCAADITSVSENVAKPVRSLSVQMIAPTASYTFKNIVVKLPNVRAPVPLFILFRALGVISDKQIITMCLLDLDKFESLVDLFEPSVHDAGGIMTQRNALKYIANLTKYKTTENALEILADYFLPHVGELNFTQKAYFLGYMVKELLLVHTGMNDPTDRDNYKFKRLELVGSLLNDLFREYYTMQMRQIHLSFEQKITYNRGIYEDNLKGLVYENYKEIFRERVLEAGFKKAFKGNWGAQPHTKRVGVIQDLNRLSHNSMMSHLRKTNLPLDSSVKLVGPRVLHSTHWGYFDPIDTPDGANVGIHKHLSISAYVTQGYSREPMIQWLREKVDMKLIEDCSPIILSKMTKVFVNGLWAGAIDIPMQTVEKIRLFRRNGLIPTYTSINFDIGRNTIYIFTDAGRICRPIFYKDNESEKFSYEVESIQKRLKEGVFTWNELISGFNKKTIPGINLSTIYELNELYENIDSESNPAKLKRFLDEKAILDYIDANESEGALIEFSAGKPTTPAQEGVAKIEVGSPATHREIHESFIFGMMANLICLPENNPAARNSFSCGQSKQACSLYHTNHQVRMDKTAVVLVNGQVPLVKTRYLEHINHEENTYGENAIVAIMCYTGYNVEDAVLFNEGSLKRGLFRTTYYTTYEAHEEKSKTGGATIDKVFTNIESEANVVGTKPGYDYSKLDKYGLIRENTPIDDKTVLVGITSSGSDNKDNKVDGSKTPKKGQLGTVDKAFITDGEEGFRIAKIRIREERIPNLGDKMACALPTQQVLTNLGWIEIKDIDISIHKVATLDINGNMCYEYPVNKFEYDHNGEMYYIKNKQVHVICTLNHKLYVKKRSGKTYEFLEAKDAIGKMLRFQKSMKNIQSDTEYIQLGNKQFKMDDWLQLVGMFISDGSVNNRAAILSCHKQRKIDFNMNILTKLGLEYKQDLHQGYIALNKGKHPEIYEELKKYSLGAANKYLPEYVWNLSQRQSIILMEALMEGDGHTYKDGFSRYGTISMRLANDVSRLAVHCGWSGIIKIAAEPDGIQREITGRIGYGKDKTHTYFQRHTYYKISVIRKQNQPFINKKQNDSNEEKLIEYEGKVYCIEMPSSHLYYMREDNFAASMLIGNSRVGQKGTVGLIIPECDMPFTKDGIRPDMIINPHAIPTRMTIGQLVESITGKACLHYGGFGDCTAFNNDGSKIKVFGEMLTNAGYHSSGNDILYNGMTGEQLETEIFMGPTYYMRLKHMVKDKINYRAQGPRTALTRQPVSGRANDGGLRIGEMERDAVISHGASSFLRESMMERGDKYFMAVCNTTGMIAIYNPNKNLFISPAADGPLKFTGSLDSQDIRVENVTKFGRDFSVICIPYSFKLLMQELQTINMQMRLITEDNIEQLENLSYSRNIEKLTYVDKFDSKTYIRQVNDIQMKANIVKEFSGKNVPEDEAKWKVLEENAASPYVLPDTPPTYSPPFSPASPPSAPVPPPFSPGSPIPEESSAESESDILSEKAQLYKGGDAVHLHGDSVPNRVWSVFSVGDRMLTIDTNNYEMLGGGNESRKVVTAAEVYPISDYSFAQGSFPMAPMVPNPNTMMGGSDMMMQPQQMMTGGMPAINFAPTFKIMNGGNDFSTEPTNEAIVGNGESTISNNINALSPQQPAMTGGTTATEQKTEPKSLDFSSFLIKKLGM